MKKTTITKLSEVNVGELWIVRISEYVDGVGYDHVYGKYIVHITDFESSRRIVRVSGKILDIIHAPEESTNKKSLGQTLRLGMPESFIEKLDPLKYPELLI